MRKIVIIIITLFIYNLALADESGWIDKGSYKYQLLKYDNLQLVGPSYDKKEFYTYNANGIVRIWDLESGFLKDSIVLDSIPNRIYFSKDCKTIVLSYWINNYYSQKIVVLNFGTKDTISTDTISIFPVFCEYAKYVGFSEYKEQTFLFDYASKYNKLFLGTYNSLSGTYGAGSLVYMHSGYLCIFDVEKDTLILTKGIICEGIKQFIYDQNDLYFSYDSDDETHYPHNYPTQYYSSYGLMKYSLDSSKLKKVFGYEKNTLLPSFLKISDIYTFFHLDLMLYKSNNKFCYYDLKNNVIIEEKSIPSLSNSYCQIVERNLLVTQESNQLNFYRVNTADLLNTIELPIQVDKILSINNNIIAYNKKGEIMLLKVDNFVSIKSDDKDREIIVQPNPASDYIEINLERCQTLSKCLTSEIKIYTPFGECVIDLTPTPFLTGEGLRIDISHLPVGMYFIQIGNYSEKFVVVR